MPSTHSIPREGVITGIIGATAVAVWFLVIDVIAGHALYTPALLGAALTSVLGDTTRDSMMLHVIVYTVFHYVAFIAAGLLLAFIVHKAETEPSVLVVFTLLFIIFELGFYLITAMLAETRLRNLAWYQIAAGNLLAALTMGVYVWRTHPALKQEFSHALGGTE